MNLASVEDGVFNQTATVNRQTVGTATLSVNHCGELVLEFDLTSQGLGADTVNLRRLFAGEIAGYTCRDLNSRIAELSQ